MDLLSNILSSIAFDALSIADFQLQAPWGIHTDGFESGFSLFVTEGSAWMGAKGQARRRLDQGHSVIAPRGTYLEYASSPTAAVSPLQDVWGEPRITALETRQPASFDVQIWGGSGAPCRLLGFAFNLNETAQEKIVGSLPDVMFLEGDTSRVDNLAKSFADILSFSDENYLPGEFALRAKIAEGIIVGQLREYIIQADFPRGWLAGLKHPQITRALDSIHKDYAAAWTVDQLAKASGMSRSAFASKFNELVGKPPMRYLNEWRVNQASRLLRTKEISVSETANAVGFSSDHVLRRHMHKLLGGSPRSARLHIDAGASETRSPRS